MGIKKESITGDDLRQLRGHLGLDPFAFAKLLGVATSTVYRWESVGANPINMDPMQRQLVEALISKLGNTRAQARADLNKAIVEALIAGGAILGLFVLLKFLTNDGAGSSPR